MNLTDIETFAATLESKELPYEGDRPYTTRYTVRKTAAGSVYLQNIHREDLDPAPHNHPWTFMCATVLHGGYRQWRGVAPDPRPEMPHWEWLENYEPQIVRPGASYTLGERDFHRIVAVEPDTWTLIVVGPKRDEWGFFVEGHGFVPWRERFEERGVKT